MRAVFTDKNLHSASADIEAILTIFSFLISAPHAKVKEKWPLKKTAEKLLLYRGHLLGVRSSKLSFCYEEGFYIQVMLKQK